MFGSVRGRAFCGCGPRLRSHRPLKAASIIGLGHSLDINIVAEGVESAEQLHILKSMGVNAVQGYLFAKPLTHSNYLKWHKQHY